MYQRGSILCFLVCTLLATPTAALENTCYYGYFTKWGRLGNDPGQFNLPDDVALDRSGNVYVVDTDNHRVQEFRTDSTFVRQWGSRGDSLGQFDHPHGIAVDNSGNVYVADAGNHRIQIFHSDGTVTQLGGPGHGNGQFYSPYGIAVDGDGNIYVTDTYNNRIQKFRSDGTYVTQWGVLGQGNGQFTLPVGVALDDSANIYVADGRNHRIQKFRSNGGFVTAWGDSGCGNGQFYYPWRIAVDGSGDVYVTEVGSLCNNRVQKFTRNGQYLTQWGTFGSGNGQLYSPYGIAVDDSGRVYVGESSNCRVQVFKPCPSGCTTVAVTCPADMKVYPGVRVHLVFGIDNRSSCRGVFDYEIRDGSAVFGDSVVLLASGHADISSFTKAVPVGAWGVVYPVHFKASVRGSVPVTAESCSTTVSVYRVSGLEYVPAMPPAVALLPNEPNPFNPTTRVRFEIPARAPVDLDVYAVSGRRVRSLLHQVTLEAGRYGQTWDGADDAGHRLASGVYVLRLHVGDAVCSRRAVVLK